MSHVHLMRQERERVNDLIANGQDSPLWASADFTLIDVEATGNDPDHDQVVEIGAVRINAGKLGFFDTLVNPGIEIPPGASAAHHITDVMVQGAPSITQAAADLRKFAGTSTLVSFNAAFEAGMLDRHLGKRGGRVGPMTGEWICLWRAASHLWPHAPGHSNQTLRYHFKTDIRDLPPEVMLCMTPGEPLIAHRALHDALVSMCTFRRALADMHATHGIEALAEVKQFCDRPIHIECMQFGKYAGVRMREIPLEYLKFALARFHDMDWDLRTALKSELEIRGRATSQDTISS